MIARNDLQWTGSKCPQNNRYSARWEIWYSPLEFNSRKSRQHLTNSTRWNKRDKVWSSANSLFKWRFRSRRRRCCLSSLLTAPTTTDHHSQEQRTVNKRRCAQIQTAPRTVHLSCELCEVSERHAFLLMIYWLWDPLKVCWSWSLKFWSHNCFIKVKWKIYYLVSCHSLLLLRLPRSQTEQS